jgi:hypothetical protein
MDVAGVKGWWRGAQKLCGYCQSHHHLKAPSQSARTHRNPSPIVLKSLPAVEIEAIIPHLLVEKLGVWGVLALLPYTSPDRWLVSIPSASLSMFLMIVRSAGSPIDSSKVEFLTLLNRSTAAYSTSVFFYESRKL